MVTLFLIKEASIYNGEKTASSISGAEKTGQLHVKYIKMRERENKERDFKELGQVIVEAGKSEICGVGPQSA